MMATTYEPIATTTLGNATTSITFSSIAASWTDLRLVIVSQDSTSGDNSMKLNFNSDTGTNYSRTKLVGNGSSAYSARDTGVAFIRVGEGGWNGPPNWLTSTFDIFSYTSSVYKTVLNQHSGDLNGSGYVARAVGLWRSTSAISSITLALFAGTMAAGTTATLYGIKAA